MSKKPKDAGDAKPEKGAKAEKPEKDAKAEKAAKPEKQKKPKAKAKPKRTPSIAAMLIPVFFLAITIALNMVLNGMGPSHAEPLGENAERIGRASVVDADTLDVHGERIRLVGVDAPEGGQKCLDTNNKFVRCGSIAANALDRFIAQSPVTCAIDGKDRYKRLLGTCSVRGQDIQDWLVRNGHALAYRDYSTAYVPAENAARTAKVGVWSGRFIKPWDWRKGARLPGEKPTKAMLEGRV
jgi:endonuclease YncB( thermonuclease family)